jgi:lysophospholipase
VSEEAVLHTVGGHRPPEGGEVSIVVARDGVPLRVARWPHASTEQTRGTIFLLHGRTEFVEKYYEVIEELRARGWAVVTFDWRGQGLSGRMLDDRQKGHVSDYAEFVADAAEIYEQMVLPDMPGPHILLGHSMGGHLGLRLVQECPGRLDRAVLTAPMLGFDRLPLPVMRAITGMQVTLGLGDRYTWLQKELDLDNPVNVVTTDEERFARNQAFLLEIPDLRLGGPTWAWLHQAAVSTQLVLDARRLGALKVPVLVASAERDTVVSSACHAVLPDRSRLVRVESIADAKHEILQETDEIRGRFWKHFDEFVA